MFPEPKCALFPKRQSHVHNEQAYDPLYGWEVSRSNLGRATANSDVSCGFCQFVNVTAVRVLSNRERLSIRSSLPTQSFTIIIVSSSNQAMTIY
jgi:hypothetical protein